MKLIAPDPEIALYEEGFGTHDLLGRAKIGKRLSGLVEAVDDPIVIALDGSWGVGKTFFLKRWVGAHQKENGGTATTIYFDAFEHDYMSDPLLALTGAIRERFETVGESGDARRENIGKALKKLALPVARVALATATAGISEAAGAVVAAAAKAGEEENTPIKIVVVIDELDRCRPDFALALLEIAKHFFAVPNVHFVLGANLAELQNSVLARYGQGIDAARYLQKFVQVTLTLPAETERGTGESVAAKYFGELVKRQDIPAMQYGGLVNEYLHHTSPPSSYSLRDAEQIATLCVLAKPAEGTMEFKIVVAGLIILKVCQPDLYNRARQGALEFKDVCEFFGFPADEDEQQSHIPGMLTAAWRALYDPRAVQGIPLQSIPNVYLENFQFNG